MTSAEGPAATSPDPIRWTRVVSVSIAAVLTLWAIALFIAVAVGAAQRGEFGFDARLYVWVGQRFLDTGVLYTSEQLTGPWEGVGMINIYPPLALYLFVPFVFLPLFLWWVIPIAVLIWHVWRCRPAVWSWPILALVAALPATVVMLVYGNTTIWSAALVALACHRPVFAPALAFKPSDLVGALVITRRLDQAIPGLLVVVLLSLPLAAYWIEWVQAMTNFEASLTRNVSALPLLFAPALVWVARRDRVTEGSGEPGLG